MTDIVNLFDRVMYPQHYWATEALLKGNQISFDDLSIEAGVEPPKVLPRNTVALCLLGIELQGGRLGKFTDKKYGVVYCYYPDLPYVEEYRVSNPHQRQLHYPVGQHMLRRLERVRAG